MNQSFLSSLNLKFLFLIFILLLGYIYCESSNDEDDTAICEPECSYGYNCENKNGDKKCIFSTTLIIIIVIISIIGICVIAAGIFFVCLCYCAAFNQTRLARFFIKPKTNAELEQDRIKYLEKIKKRPAYPANYFDELRRKSPIPKEFGTENTGTPTSSGNEKTFQSKPIQTAPAPILGERSKSIYELFPPATVTTPNDNKNIINNGSTKDKPPAVSPNDKPSISPNDKPAVSPGRMM